MNDLFKELIENCKVIYDDDNFAYFKADDVEKLLLDIDKTVGSGDCVENGFAFIEKYLCDLGEDLNPFSHEANEVRKLERQAAQFRLSYRHIKAEI